MIYVKNLNEKIEKKIFYVRNWYRKKESQKLVQKERERSGYRIDINIIIFVYHGKELFKSNQIKLALYNE